MKVMWLWEKERGENIGFETVVRTRTFSTRRKNRAIVSGGGVGVWRLVVTLRSVVTPSSPYRGFAASSTSFSAAIPSWKLSFSWTVIPPRSPTLSFSTLMSSRTSSASPRSLLPRSMWRCTENNSDTNSKDRRRSLSWMMVRNWSMSNRSTRLSKCC